MQIGHKMTELEAFEVLSVVLDHPVQTLFTHIRNVLPYLRVLMDFSFFSTLQNIFVSQNVS